MEQFSRVLAAVDFSKPARGAFEYALALSQRHAAELVVAQAVPPNQELSWHAPQRNAFMARLRRKADEANVEFVDRVKQGDPAKIILSHVNSLHPDVVVLGTHQRAGIDRFANGSVAERVATKSSAPALVVPYRKRKVTVERFSHLAVAVDFSASSNRAIEQALALSSDPADRITLLHLVPDSSSVMPRYSYRNGIAEYQDRLMRDARRRRQLTIPAIRTTPTAIDVRVLLGYTATQISGVVDTIGADLLVVGVPKRGVVSQALFGTAATRLLRVSHIPVLAVPEAASPSAHQETASLQQAA